MVHRGYLGSGMKIAAWSRVRGGRLCPCLALFVLALRVPGDAVGAEPAPRPTCILIDVGGHRLEAEKGGHGQPTVVFELGASGTLDTWQRILPRVAEYTSAISYTRAGRGASEPASGPRHPPEITEELRTLLRRADLTPPYVLVAKSLGGIYARTFASLHPQEVAGLVLIDGSHERQEIEFSRAVSEYADALAKRRSDSDVRDEGSLAFLREGESSAVALPDVPMVVITSTKIGAAPRGMGTPEGRRVWRGLHADIFQATSNGMHIVTSKSGHNIERDEPELVLSAVRWVVDRVRQEKD